MMKFILFLVSIFFACEVAAQVEDSLKLNQMFEIAPIEDLKQLEQIGSEKNNFEKETKTTQEFLNFRIESIIIDEGEKPVVKAVVKDPGETLDVPIGEYSTRYQRLATGPTPFDSRIELMELSLANEQQRKMLTNSKSVGMVVHKDILTALTDSIYSFDVTSTLAKRLNVCPEEPYAQQLSVGLGTAFILGVDTLMTANHVFQEPLENYRVIFNYHTQSRSGAVDPVVFKKDVYAVTQLVDQNMELDVVRFQVDRKLSAPALPTGKTENVQENTPVYMIGHPSGLPAKVALNARVHENTSSTFFYTTLDAFQGNSGSPVFDLERHEVIGILVSGEQDFYWTGSCYKSTICEIPYCLGEKVIRINQVLND